MGQYIHQNTDALHHKNNPKCKSILRHAQTRLGIGIFALMVGLFFAFSGVRSAEARRADTIMAVPISTLHPTQPAIGFAEVKYTVARYRQNPSTLFDDFCHDSGAGKVVSIVPHSTLTKPDSFRCAEPVGSHPNAMKSAVIAPDGQVYLTDGHHSVSAFRAIAPMADFVLPVRITEDLRDLPSMGAFWHYLQQHQQVWLAGAGGNIDPQSLPQQVGLTYMQDDPYRSLVYFLRDVAYQKPRQAPPFLEFYLAAWLRDQLPITAADLATQSAYFALVKKAALILTNAVPETHSLSDSASPTLRQLGQLTEVDIKKRDKLNEPGGKLSRLFNVP